MWLFMKRVHCIFGQLILGCYHKKGSFNGKSGGFRLFSVACVSLPAFVGTPTPTPTLTHNDIMCFLWARACPGPDDSESQWQFGLCCGGSMRAEPEWVRNTCLQVDCSFLSNRVFLLSLLTLRWTCFFQHIYWTEKLLQFFIYFVF